jgi:hypothetical protein
LRKNSNISKEKRYGSQYTKQRANHKTIKKNKTDYDNINQLKYNKGRMTKQFKDRFANSGATCCTVTLIHNNK